MDRFNGKVWLWRKLENSDLWPDHNASRVLVWLMLRVAWDETSFRGVKLLRGQMILPSVRWGAKQCCMDHVTFHRALRRLIDKYETVSETEVKHGQRMLTLINYGSYQDRETEVKQEVKQARNRGETEVKQRCNKSETLNEEGNKERREEGKKKPAWRPDLSSIPAELNNDEGRLALSTWIAHRKEIGKPYKPTSWESFLRVWAGHGSARLAAAVQHTVANGWQGLREPEVVNGRAKEGW